ncbi:amylo-alpha-1,6-glucosidase [soil metagenome]
MKFELTQWLRNQANDTLLPIQASSLSDLTDLGSTDTREWLITNGLGTYAGAAISGANTRRYHGLLVASLQPPVKRTLLLSRLDESLTVEGQSTACELATNYWQSGYVHPQGYLYLEAFSELPVPTWSYRVSGGRLIKQVLMLHGQQRVHVGYTWLPYDGAKTASLELSVLLSYRDFHSETRGSNTWQFAQNIVSEKQVKVEAFNGAQPLWLELDHGSYSAQPDWYWNYKWPREFERGLGDREDAFRSGIVRATLAAGESITFTAGFEPFINDSSSNNSESDKKPSLLEALVRQCASEKRALLKKTSSETVQRLILAADQFIAHRQSTDGSTIIAGYHWFSDWGRDSMISLFGLCLATGRLAEARSILSTFGRYLSEGMLPNYFPDGGQEPEYNTSDATLWWAWALHGYYKTTGDIDFVKAQLPLLQEVVDWHKKGTRHGLKLDSDGLITGGDASVQLTWMDAKVGSYVVTPRSGKAVEINALWYNFLLTLNYLRSEVATKIGAASLTAATEDYTALAAQCAIGFEKFWIEKEGYLVDVIRQDGSLDLAIRPNQLLAASLSYPLLSQEKAKRMLAVVESKLLTPMGLRTLSPDHPEYQGVYGTGLLQADQYHRDITYHQGTVWPWLLGPWVSARLYVNATQSTESIAFIRNHLQPIIAHIMSEGCLGSINEIFDGDAPHTPRGCVSQAWSVAELLRVLNEYPELN